MPDRVSDRPATTVSARCFFAIVVCYLQGTLLYTMYDYQSLGHDAWVALFVAGALFVPCALLYCALFARGGREALPGLLERAYGQRGGKVCAALYAVYFIYMCALNLRQSVQFVNANIMTEIPNWLPTVLLLIPCLLACRAGLRYFSSVAPALSAILYLLLLLLSCLLLRSLRPDFLLPVLHAKPFEYLRGSLLCFTMPFGELVCVLLMMPHVRFTPARTRTLPLFRSLLGGFLLGFLFMAVIVVRDSMILGPFSTVMSYPSYEVIRFARVGNVLARIESIFDLPFLFILSFRLSVQLWCAAELLRELLPEGRVRRLTVPGVCVLAGLLSQYMTRSNVGLLNWVLSRLPLLLLVPQLLIPGVAFLVLACKKRKNIV